MRRPPPRGRGGYEELGDTKSWGLPRGALTACNSHHRQMVDRLGGTIYEDLHRVAAVATKRWRIPRAGAYEVALSPLAVATIARWWIGSVERYTKSSTAWPRWLRRGGAYEELGDTKRLGLRNPCKPSPIRRFDACHERPPFTEDDRREAGNRPLGVR
jgi:hypothetical protein